MSTTFNDLLLKRGIGPGEVALLRHHTPKRGATAATIADLWRDDAEGFVLYQDTQKENRPIFRTRKIWASFVSPVPGETLFVGLFDAEYLSTAVADWTCPYRGDQPGDGQPVDRFSTRLRSELSEQIGKLRVDWPDSNVRTWKRKAEGLTLPVVPSTLVRQTGLPIRDAALVDALEAIGFEERNRTGKVVQMRRGDLVVYVKRETATRPLVVHPGFLDVADSLRALGVDTVEPPRSYVNAHLREFPEYIAPHRTTVGRHGFALGVSDTNLVATIALLEGASRVETDDGPVRVVAPAEDPLTEKERLQAARVGQGDFRNALVVAWDGMCPLAAVDHLPLLRASHIKPWRSSTNAERLDPFNGLLLAVHVDALFDRGLISFEDTGTLLISSTLSQDNLDRLGIVRGAMISGLDARHGAYLAHHRAHCFVP
jgi:hypothetical protein